MCQCLLTPLAKVSPPRDKGSSRRLHPHAGGENDSAWPAYEFFGSSPRGWGQRESFQAGRDMRTIPTRVGRTPGAARQIARCADHPHAGGENDARESRSDRADHPHAGGENVVADVSAWTMLGPSPRGWGEHRSSQDPGVAARTIPTRVGRTAGRSRVGCSALGSSPRGWGEPFCHVRVAPDGGPSPRGWGERKTHEQADRPPATDHPHAGGESTWIFSGL